MRDGDRDATWAGEESIDFPTRQHQIEIRECLAEHLSPIHHGFGRQHPLRQPVVGLNPEAEPLGERRDRLLRTGVWTCHQQLEFCGFQVVC